MTLLRGTGTSTLPEGIGAGVAAEAMAVDLVAGYLAEGVASERAG